MNNNNNNNKNTNNNNKKPKGGAPFPMVYGQVYGQILEEPAPIDRRFLFWHRLRIVLAVILIVVLLLATGLFVIKREEQNTEQRQNEAERSAVYIQMLEDKRVETGLPLRNFTNKEVHQMVNGERTPEDVIQEIIDTNTTTAPPTRQSNKTPESLESEYRYHLDECIKEVGTGIKQVIEDAKPDYEKIKDSDNPQERTNFLNKYSVRVSNIEGRVNMLFDEYMENLRKELKELDGSIDEDDQEMIERFYNEYFERKETEVHEFEKAYGLKS